MSEIYRNPQLYKTLGQLAVALGDPNSFGAKAGAYGQQESENWAARDAQEKAEREAKKKKNAGLGGTVGSIAGGVGGFLVGGPAGAAVGAGLGSAGGNAIGGGTENIDWGNAAISAGMAGLGGAMVPAAAPVANGGAMGAIPAIPGAATETALGAAVPAIAPSAAATGAAPIAGAAASGVGGAASSAGKMMTDTNALLSKVGLNGPNAQAAGNFINEAYGGPQGVFSQIKAANDAPLDINGNLQMGPGLSLEGFTTLKQNARADEALGAQKQTAAATAAYRQQSATNAAQRAQLDQQRFQLEQQKANRPVQIDVMGDDGLMYKTLADPNTMQAIPGAPRNPQGYATGMAPQVGFNEAGVNIHEPASGRIERIPSPMMTPQTSIVDMGEYVPKNVMQRDSSGNVTFRPIADSQKSFIPPAPFDVERPGPNGPTVQPYTYNQQGQMIPVGPPRLMSDDAKAKAAGSNAEKMAALTIGQATASIMDSVRSMGWDVPTDASTWNTLLMGDETSVPANYLPIWTAAKAASDRFAVEAAQGNNPVTITLLEPDPANPMGPRALAIVFADGVEPVMDAAGKPRVIVPNQARFQPALLEGKK